MSGLHHRSDKIVEAYQCRACDSYFEHYSLSCPMCRAINRVHSTRVNAETLAPKKRRPEMSLREEDGDIRQGRKERSDEDDEARPEVFALDEIDIEEHVRIPTGITELDEALGGGMVAGKTILLSGDAGIGKSSLSMSALANMAKKSKVLNATGEEEGEDVARRAYAFGYFENAPTDRKKRAIGRNLKIAEIETLEQFFELIEDEEPEIAVLDSITVIGSDELPDAEPGSPKLLKHLARRISDFSKETGVIILIICHATKKGDMSGPNTVRHWVSTHLNLRRVHPDNPNDRQRVLEVTKNRLGPENVSYWQMTDHGLLPEKKAVEAVVESRPKPKKKPSAHGQLAIEDAEIVDD